MMYRFLFYILPHILWSYAESHQVSSYKDGAELAKSLHQNAIHEGVLSHEEARHVMPHMIDHPDEHNSKSAVYEEQMKDVVKEQLKSDRPRIDPKTDPIFINGNQAIEDPKETLKKQTILNIKDDDYEDMACVDTRDDEFDVVHASYIDPYYKRFEVSMYYNSCFNHSGWGKVAAASCGNKHLHKITRRVDMDYEEIHGMEWKRNDHPEFEQLFSSGKCRLKQELPHEEGKRSRMIPVEFLKKDETMTGWNYTKIEEYRQGRSRLRNPQDFGVDSFKKTQIYTCSYKSPGNTCQRLRDKGGIEKTSVCIEQMGDVCVKWRKVYKVPKDGAVQRKKVIDLTEGYQEPFNLHGDMHDQTSPENKEAPEVITKLKAFHNVGQSMSKTETGDPHTLTVFHGEELRCASQGGYLSHHGCPNERGKKDPHEQKLERLHNEGKCIYVGSYEENKNIGTAIGQKRKISTYCCFESVLSKVLQTSSVQQGLKSMGHAQSPNCSALTLGHIQSLNWDIIDFSPFTSDVLARTNLNAKEVSKRSATIVKDHLSHQVQAAQRQEGQR